MPTTHKNKRVHVVVPKELLETIDAQAARYHQTRNGIIRMLLVRGLNGKTPSPR